jgi:hypothetical protein
VGGHSDRSTQSELRSRRTSKRPAAANAFRWPVRDGNFNRPARPGTLQSNHKKRIDSPCNCWGALLLAPQFQMPIATLGATARPACEMSLCKQRVACQLHLCRCDVHDTARSPQGSTKSPILSSGGQRATLRMINELDEKVKDFFNTRCKFRYIAGSLINASPQQLQ